MTQFQHTLRPLLLGEKRETSRIALPEPDGTGGFACEMISYPLGVPAVRRYLPGWKKWRTIWETGKEYAIVPRRGVKSVGRYRVEKIWRQDVRTLTWEQWIAEGFENGVQFMNTWTKMHDPSAHEIWKYHRLPHGEHKSAVDFIESRPAERYQAWRMTISVLWETVDWNAPAVRALQIEPHGAILKETF